MNEATNSATSHPYVTNAAHHPRMQWLDALRGFTMLLVVANHVYGMTLNGPSNRSMLMSLCLLFRMPLFFFISGFLAYKVNFSWNLADTGHLLLKKLRVQIVPTVALMTAYVALVAKHFWEQMGHAWMSPTKSGFWFTLVLLQMFIVYYAVCFVTRRMQYLRDDDDDSLMTGALVCTWIIALIGYATLYMPAWFSWQKDEFYQATSLTEFVRFFHCFMLGNLCHRFWPQVQRLLDTSWFYPLIILVAFVCAGDYLVWHNLRMQWANLPRTLAIYSLVLIVVAFFRHYDEWFDKERPVGRWLQFIGVRTLDIYLLHYFFLPNLRFMRPWLKAHPTSFVLDGTISLAITVAVMAFTLLASHVLRVSPFIKKWLFGR